MIDKTDKQAAQRRSRVVALVAASMVWVIGSVVVLLLPDQFAAEAIFSVSTKDFASEQSLRDEMLRSTVLAQVAQETGLLESAATPNDVEALIDNLRQAISIDRIPVIRRGRAHDDAGIYSISYEADEPSKAVAIVGSVLQAFIMMNTKRLMEERDRANRHLDRVLAQWTHELRDMEGRLVECRERYGSPPDERRIRQLQLIELKLTEHDRVEVLRDSAERMYRRDGANCHESPSNPRCLELKARLNRLNLEIDELEVEIGALVGHDQVGAPSPIDPPSHNCELLEAEYREASQRFNLPPITGYSEPLDQGVSILRREMASSDPVGPNRPLLLIMVLLGAFGVGAVVAYLLHLFGRRAESDGNEWLPLDTSTGSVPSQESGPEGKLP